MSLRKSRKPIFQKKNKPAQSNMYHSTPNFFKETTYPNPNPIDYHSRIIYGPKDTTPTRVHSVAKTNKPITITVCPPNRPQSTIGRHAPQFANQQPLIVQNRVSSPMIRSSYSNHNLQSQVIVRAMNESQPFVKRSYINPAQQSMKSSMIRKSDIRPTVVAVERVMRPLDGNQNDVEKDVTVFKPHHQAESQYFEARHPQEVRNYQPVQRKINISDHNHQRIHKLSVMNEMLTSSYDDLYD